MRTLLFLVLVAGAFAEDPSPTPEGQAFAFNADVARLMNLIINSLYSNKDIFLRELISNAADASDKARYLALSNPDFLGEGDQRNLEIHVDIDEEAKTLTIRDKGLGMTKKDLIDDLGTIARSGTQSFVDALQKSADVNLIGQFGVGFYSAYLVADKVTVVTKHNDDTQYIWESDASETFTIREDPEGNTLGRGTKIILHLKEEERDKYLDSDKLKALAIKYSEFIDVPLYIKMKKTEKVEVPEEEEEEETPAPKKDDAGDEEVQVEPEEKKEKKMKTVEQITWEYELVNAHKPIWMRNPKEVTDEEYANFYKALTKESVSPLAHIHFKQEGVEVNFRGLLYVPETSPFNAFEFIEKSKHIKVYVKRVLIADEFEDFLPRYLNFVRGIVDSDDLPLNVSREMLQESNLLKTIAKRLVRKIIEMFGQIAKRDDQEDYRKFWRAFGKNIKVGIIEDTTNRNRLAKLLRFESTKSGGELISLDQYVNRTEAASDKIYYIPGESVAAVRNSPFLDAARRRGIEVLYFTEPLDEYLTTVLSSYESKRFVSVTKEDAFGEDDKDKEAVKLLKEHYEPLTSWFKATLGDRIERAVVSLRLRDASESPCVLANTASSFSGNMERILKAQAAVDERVSPINARKVLEINPRHPLMRRLLELVRDDPQDKKTTELGFLLYDAAAIDSGYILEDTPAFVRKVFAALGRATGDPTEPEPEVPEAVAAPEAEAEAEPAPSSEIPPHDEL